MEISDSSLDESFTLEGKLDGGVGEIAKCAASLPPLVHAAPPLSGSEPAGVPQGREQDGRRHCQAEEQRRTEPGGRRGLVPVDSRGRPTGARAWLPASSDPSDSPAPAQTGYSTQPSGYVVETERAHRKRTAIHYWEWTFYAVAAGLAVGLPGTAYQQQGS